MGICFVSQGDAQTYYAYRSEHGQDQLVRMVHGCKCPQCCDLTVVGATRKWQTRLGISPAREVFGIDGDLYKIDTLNGNSTLVMGLHGLGELKGLIAMDGGIFYTFELTDPSHANLIRIDVAASTITNVGLVSPHPIGDMCFFEGEIYYPSTRIAPFFLRHISKLNLDQPDHSTNVAFVPLDYLIVGLSATDVCNTLIAIDTTMVDELLYINLKDGDVETATGSAVPMCLKTEGLTALVSVQELKSPSICNYLDLDCNDSSLATGGDYNVDTFNCLSLRVHIVDKDVQVFHDTIIEEIRIKLTGSIPDGLNEYLEVDGSYYSIVADGDGTQEVVLLNGGPATFPHFNYLLQRIYYHNDASYPTGGIRTIEIQFVTASGEESDIATAFVPVIELPKYEVDLGDSIVMCQGESIVLDAFNQGARYLWSTGSTQPGITVNFPGYYNVHVYGFDKCPNWDTVYVNELPVVAVSLSGDGIFCGEEQPEIYLNVNSAYELDISISASTDTTFIFNNVGGSEYLEVDIPLGSEITYTLTDVVASDEACIEIGNEEVTLGHYPSYEQVKPVSICDGDSVLIGYDYESVAGTYDRAFYTEAGCDSNVTFILSLLPVKHTFSSATSCEAADTGIFNLMLTGINGCDSIHQTTVTYLAGDITHIDVPTCRQADAGVFQAVFPNLDGCDSLVITNAYYVPPHDTTRLTLLSCDVNELGQFLSIATDVEGCDSISITSIILAPVDTTYLYSSSCDPANTGVFESVIPGHDGCDSFIISTVSFSLSDTTYTQSTSCDSSSLGVFESHFVDSEGCDSTVFHTITYSSVDSVAVFGTSCDPGEAGIFINHYVNRFGCDSVVTETISLIPIDTTFISSTTCDPGEAGTIIHILSNAEGCDSIVNEIINLLPVSETFFSGTACRSSEAGVFVEVFTAQNGCDSIVTTTVTLVPADTTRLAFNTCFPEEVGDIEHLYPNVEGCDSLVISTFSLFPLPALAITQASDFNGYGVSCFGKSDGSVSAIATGTEPFNFEWSNGETQQLLSDLLSGEYSVTVTDANGCRVTDSVVLTEPPPFSISSVLSNLDCYGPPTGDVSITPQGGIAPIQYSIDAIHFQPSSDFNNLDGGNYNVIAIDANGCEADLSLHLDVPLQVHVELGDDFLVELGDTAFLNALINIPVDSIASVEWYGLPGTNCPACLSQWIIPSHTATYSVSIATLDGCIGEDEITIRIGKYTDMFVPNVFSPNGDGENDILFVSAGKAIEEIASFTIFDRWGSIVFHAEHFPPEDPLYGWNGTRDGKPVNNGVFVYRMMATLKNGSSRLRLGDVTLIR